MFILICKKIKIWYNYIEGVIVYWDVKLEKILDFRDSRDWKQYHSGKDLSISILL